MTTIKLKRPHDYQREILRDKTRFRVVVTGRRFGKTELGKSAVVRHILNGETVWYCAPTYKLAKQVWREFKRIVKPIPAVKLNNSDMRCDLPNGGNVQFVSLQEPDNLRGAGLDFIVIDEAAFVGDGVWDKVLYPMLLTTQGRALFLSSPNGTNWFYRLYLRGQDEAHPSWRSWQMPSSASPLVDESELADIRLTTPERVFRQEYLAEFLNDGGSVFRNITACIYDDEPNLRQPEIIFGVDLGRYNDYTVITAIDRKTRTVIEIDRFTDTAWSIQEMRLKAMAARLNPRVVWIEENFNDKFAEDLSNAGLPVRFFRTTNASKAQVINNLALAFEQSDIRIPNHAALIGELQAFTVNRLPSGALRYEAPSGIHDDTVMSLALAWHGVTHGQVTIEVSRYA